MALPKQKSHHIIIANIHFTFLKQHPLPEESSISNSQGNQVGCVKTYE
jgi:hypothetical protein